MSKHATRSEVDIASDEAEARSRLVEFFRWNDSLFEASQSTSSASTWSIAADSSIAKDDEASSPFLMSGHLLSQIHAAVEHIDACGRLLRGDSGVIHVQADYTLIRSAIESAALAHWVLMPGQRPERVRRVLRVAMQDTRDAAKLIGDRAQGADLVQGREKMIGEVAARQGLIPAECVAWYTTTKVLEDVGTRVDADPLFAWRLCSGMAHGKDWAMQVLSDRKDIARANGVVTQRLTPRTGNLMVACFSYVQIMRQLLPVFHGRRGAVPHEEPRIEI